MATRWDAARGASRRVKRTYKPVAPVGEFRPTHSWTGPVRHRTTIGPYDVSTCRGCGYHVCSCKPEPSRGLPLGRMALAEAVTQELPPGDRAAAIELLLTGKLPEAEAMQVAQEPGRVALLNPLTKKPYEWHCRRCGIADGNVAFGSMTHEFATCPGVGGRHG